MTYEAEILSHLRVLDQRYKPRMTWMQIYQQALAECGEALV